MSRALILLFLSVFAFVGCGTTIEGNGVDRLSGSEWRLSDLPGRNLAQVAVNRRPTLAFNEGRMRGRGLCNPLTASYTIGKPGEIRLGRVAAGKVPCTEVEFLEDHLIRQLEGVTGYRVEGERLILVTHRGREIGFDRLPTTAAGGSGI
jgi:heat shock protein HslJ